MHCVQAFSLGRIDHRVLEKTAGIGQYRWIGELASAHRADGIEDALRRRRRGIALALKMSGQIRVGDVGLPPLR